VDKHWGAQFSGIYDEVLLGNFPDVSMQQSDFTFNRRNLKEENTLELKLQYYVMRRFSVFN
jgi:hypothetical protein